MTQCEMVINHIKQYGSITTAEAFDMYGITRLPARIADLSKSYAIKAERVATKNKSGKIAHYCRYRLAGEGDDIRI